MQVVRSRSRSRKSLTVSGVTGIDVGDSGTVGSGGVDADTVGVPTEIATRATTIETARGTKGTFSSFHAREPIPQLVVRTTL
ncbi:MAG: hypothetical protein RLZ19_748 [Actinomycetota bacterium]|jgi:hypothetical protein